MFCILNKCCSFCLLFIHQRKKYHRLYKKWSSNIDNKSAY